MQLPDVSAASKRSISTVTIGALKEDGGTRGKTVTVGGQTALPHLTFDGELPHRPVIAGYVADVVPGWPDFVKTAIGSEMNSPIEWAQKTVEVFGVSKKKAVRPTASGLTALCLANEIVCILSPAFSWQGQAFRPNLRGNTIRST